MKKVTLGLLITFVAAALVAGPKPTPTKGPVTGVKGSKSNSSFRTGPTNPNEPNPTPIPGVGAPCCVKGSKSNSSYREGEGGKNDGEKNVTPGAVDRTTTTNNSRSNSYREIPPTSTPEVGKGKGKMTGYERTGPTNPNEPNPTPIPGSVAGVKGSKSNVSFRSGDVEPTPGTPVGATNKSWETHEIKVREMAPTAKPNPRGNTPTDVQPFGSGTNKADLKGEGDRGEGAPVKPSPAVGPVNAISLNSSRSNIVDERRAPGTSQYQAARVLSQQGRRLTVQLGNGQTVVVDSSSLNPAPRVGSTVTVTNSHGNWVIVTR